MTAIRSHPGQPGTPAAFYSDRRRHNAPAGGAPVAPNSMSPRRMWRCAPPAARCVRQRSAATWARYAEPHNSS